MKILAIRGRNLASLEGDFEIDFTAEPLLSAGIFAISGPTGAGKIYAFGCDVSGPVRPYASYRPGERE